VSARTFYLAASSQRPLDARLAMRDVEALGYQNLADWTLALAAPVGDYPRLAEEDVRAARDADLFVFLAHPLSHGAFLELGSRLGAGKRAHVVNPGAAERHFFTFHPLVVLHATWQGFVDAAARESRGAL
jgi:hypothetical protein